MSSGWLWSTDEPEDERTRKASASAKRSRPSPGVPEPIIPGTVADSPLTVSQLNQIVKGVLDDNIPPIWIEAEISDLARPSSGQSTPAESQRMPASCSGLNSPVAV